MGMQCHFNISDLKDAGLSHTRDYDKESDTTCILVADGYAMRGFSVDNDPSKNSAWFDVGNWTSDQMRSIEFLVRNRICFQCS